jgi:hypothetical protein
VPVVQGDQLLGAVGAHADHDQQAHLVLLEADLEVDPVDPHVHVVGLGQGAHGERGSFVLPVLGQPGDRGGDSPWPVPRNWVNAGPKSPLDRPCRYSSGNTSATCGDFLAHAGRIAEENRLPLTGASSIRLSLTRGARTGTAPAAVVTSRVQRGTRCGPPAADRARQPPRRTARRRPRPRPATRPRASAGRRHARSHRATTHRARRCRRWTRSLLDYLEHGRTFPSRRVNADPDQNLSMGFRSCSGGASRFTSPRREPSTGSDHCS